MEDNNNNIDTSAILSQLQTLNEGVSSVNQQTKELVNYLVVKDKEEAEAKRQAEEAQKKENKEAEEQAIKEAEEQASKDEQAQAETETYTELLTNIRDGIELQNQMQASQILFFGIICGVLLVKIFFDRFIR